jgi:hypothetical protein
MKIALCLSGHLRNFEKAYPSLFFYLIKNYDVDVFIHTWDKLGFSCRFKTDRTLNDTSTKEVEIKTLYKPKSMIIEPSDFVEDLKRQGDEYAPHLRNEPKHVGHMASMFYKIYACNELKNKYQRDTGTEYDWVIRCRADLIFQSNVEMPKEKKAGAIWTPRALSSADWCNDQFAIGGPNEMDLYSSAFFDIPEYFRAGGEFYPEKFLVWALQKKKLTNVWHDIRFNIYR